MKGAMSADYSGLLHKDNSSANSYTATGVGNSIIANRVSHLFHLKGPSMTVDTACSSGMITVHLGAGSIHSGTRRC